MLVLFLGEQSRHFWCQNLCLFTAQKQICRKYGHNLLFLSYTRELMNGHRAFMNNEKKNGAIIFGILTAISWFQLEQHFWNFPFQLWFFNDMISVPLSQEKIIFRLEFHWSNTTFMILTMHSNCLVTYCISIILYIDYLIFKKKSLLFLAFIVTCSEEQKYVHNWNKETSLIANVTNIIKCSACVTNITLIN